MKTSGCERDVRNLQIYSENGAGIICLDLFHFYDKPLERVRLRAKCCLYIYDLLFFFLAKIKSFGNLCYQTINLSSYIFFPSVHSFYLNINETLTLITFKDISKTLSILIL